ncbi:MAG: hypothetical protein MUP44_02740 [Anaerolineales bacterium]|nr:hypothetical protein [Anaerolineales bacterium]
MSEPEESDEFESEFHSDPLDFDIDSVYSDGYEAWSEPRFKYEQGDDPAIGHCAFDAEDSMHEHWMRGFREAARDGSELRKGGKARGDRKRYALMGSFPW